MMKTSSKLLIILAIALFVVPISIMSFTVLRGHVDYDEYESDLAQELSSVDAEDVYLQTTALKAFRKISVKGKGRLGPISLTVIKSDKYAVKTHKNEGGNIKFDVDKQGVLTLHGEDSENYNYNRLYIFTPELHHLDLQGVDVQTKIETDSLLVRADNLQGFRFISGTKIGTLQLDVSKSKIALNGTNRDEGNDYVLENVLLNLDSCQVSLEKQNWKTVALRAKDSKINFINKNKDWQVNELSVATEGLNNIVLDSLQTSKLSGSISDQTTIDLPVYQLRKLIGTN